MDFSEFTLAMRYLFDMLLEYRKHIMPSTLNHPLPSPLKSQRAYSEVFEWIRTGRYVAGERLPSEREMAELLELNHITVRRGLARLVKEGVIEKRPNVGNFVAQSTRVAPLALVLPEYLQAELAGHPWAGMVLAGGCAAIDPTKYSLSTLYYRSGRLWEDVGRALQNAGVKGILLAPDSSVQPEQVRRLLEAGVNVVATQDVSRLAVLSLPAVQPDHGMALTQLIYGLHERGHRRIRVAMYTCNPLRDELLNALRNALEQTVLGGLDHVLLDIPNPPGVALTESYRAMTDALTASQMPSAVVVPDEFAAADLFQACYRLGIRIPDDLSIAAMVDHTPRAYAVSLTAPNSVVAARQTGEIAIEQLVALTQDSEVSCRRILLRSDVVWRDSVASVETVRPTE